MDCWSSISVNRRRSIHRRCNDCSSNIISSRRVPERRMLIAEKRIYPAINIRRSGTRREDMMFDEQSLQRLWILRRLLTEMEDQQSIEFLLDKLRQTKTNDEFFDNMRGGGKSS